MWSKLLFNMPRTQDTVGLARTLMTFLLLKVSAILMLDKQQLKTTLADQVHRVRSSASIPKRPSSPGTGTPT